MPRDKKNAAIGSFKGAVPKHANGTVGIESTRIRFVGAQDVNAVEMLLLLNTDASNILYVSFDNNSWFPIYSQCSLSLDDVGISELYLKSDAAFDNECTYAMLIAY